MYKFDIDREDVEEGGDWDFEDETENTKTVAIVFSYNRPLQLDACLKSLKLHCKDYGDLEVKVLYKAGDSRFANAYEQCKEENEGVEFVREVSFQTNLSFMLMG